MSTNDELRRLAAEQRARAAHHRAQAHANRHDKVSYDYHRDQAAQADSAAAAYEAAAQVKR